MNESVAVMSRQKTASLKPSAFFVFFFLQAFSPPGPAGQSMKKEHVVFLFDHSYSKSTALNIDSNFERSLRRSFALHRHIFSKCLKVRRKIIVLRCYIRSVSTDYRRVFLSVHPTVTLSVRPSFPMLVTL